jgi:hypothetical protein
MESQISDLFNGPRWDLTQSTVFRPKLSAFEALEKKVSGLNRMLEKQLFSQA